MALIPALWGGLIAWAVPRQTEEQKREWLSVWFCLRLPRNVQLVEAAPLR